MLPIILLFFFNFKYISCYGNHRTGISVVGGNHDFRNKLISCDSFAPSPEADDVQHPEREQLWK